MIHETFFPESPKSTSEKYINEEEAIFEIFNPQTFEKMDIQEEESIDNLIYMNQPHQNTNEDGLLIMDDYESVYQKFANIKENINSNLENENLNKPSFYLDLNINENKFNSPIIEEGPEMVINIETSSQEDKIKSKEKVLEADEEKKVIKEGKNEIIICLNNKDISTKKRRRRRRKYCKERVDTEDKCFPFTTGKGMILCSKINDELTPQISSTNSCDSSQDTTPKSQQDSSPPNRNAGNKEESFKFKEKKNKGSNKGFYEEEKPNEEVSYYNEQVYTPNDFVFRFKVKKYFIAENGKKKRIKKKRKFKPDDIRKKIKARFHKTIKNIINENLKKAGSKVLFDFLPQCFIGNVSKKTNSKCLELTYKELLSTDFLQEFKKGEYRNSKVDHNKYLKNIEVLKYLENNPDICQRSGFDLIKDRKYKDILKIYFTSAQFENSLIQLKEERESPEYIQEYINRARTYVSFYCNVKKKKDKKEENKIEKDIEVEDEYKEDEKDNKYD